MNCTSVTPLSIDVCRLCTKSHEYYVNIFISNESCEMMVEESIQDLLGLPVAVGDGLPNVVCRLCLRKLIELWEFKNMCFASASELRAYAMGNDFLVSKVKDEDSADVETSREGSNQENSFLNDIQVTEVYLTTPYELAIGNVSHSKEELWSSENALVVKEEVNDGGNYAEDDEPVTALADVAVDPLAVDTMVSKIKDEDAADVETSRDGSNQENTFMNDIHVTEMYITTPDELAIGNVSQAKEEFISSENVLVVKEEVNDGEHGIEGDVPVTALASVAVDPLAVDTMSHAKEEFISSENILVVKEEVNDGEHGIEGDMPVTALASVAVDPLAVDTMLQEKMLSKTLIYSELRKKSATITYKQTQVMTSYMADHRNFAKGLFLGPTGKVNHQCQWVEVKDLLNAHGPHKSVEQWKKAWKDLKGKVHAKNAKVNMERRATGNAPASTPPLTDEELKVLGVIGRETSTPMLDSEDVDEPMDNDFDEEVDMPLVAVEEITCEVESTLLSPPTATHDREPLHTNRTPLTSAATSRGGLQREVTNIRERLNSFEERSLNIMEGISESLRSLAQTQGEMSMSLARIATALENQRCSCSQDEVQWERS